MGLTGLEPVTSALSGRRSNRLSYRPAAPGGTATHYSIWTMGLKSWIIYTFSMAHMFERMVDAVFAILFAGRRKAAYEPLIDLLDPKPGERVLDAGSGSGWLGRRVVRRVAPGGSVIGIDPSASAVSYAKSQAGPNERYLQASITDIPLASESVDKVVTSLVLHHVDADSQPTAFAEMARALRPGGTLLVIELLRPTSAWSKLAFGWQGCVRASLPDADLRSLAASAGLVSIETGRHWRWLRWLRASRPATTAIGA